MGIAHFTSDAIIAQPLGIPVFVPLAAKGPCDLMTRHKKFGDGLALLGGSRKHT